MFSFARSAFPSPPTLSATLLCLGFAACGDDVATTGAETSAVTVTVTATATATATATMTGTSGTTANVSGSDGESTTAGTTASSGLSATESDSDSGDCVCTPGETMGCEDGLLMTCKDDCSGYEGVACDSGECVDGLCTAPLCDPGAAVCDGPEAYKVCADDGEAYGRSIPCDVGQGCSGAGECLDLCELIKVDASSVGCVFRANKMQNYQEEPSALAIGNVSETQTAEVNLYFNDSVVDGPVQVMPGQSHVFDLTMPSQPGPVSVFRPDSTYKVVSDVPVVAYLHSPIAAEAHNDSSMLLPDHAQGKSFIVAAYKPNIDDNPAYINIIGLEDDTKVVWTPPVTTAGGDGIAGVPANTAGDRTIGDYDLLQLTAGQGDLSGTVLTSDKPIWVVGAVQCVNIPANVTFCDHIEEQMIPLEYWGETYVGAHAPKRGSESFYWRVYGGDEGVTVDAEPAQPGFPITLAKGQFHEFNTQDSVIFSGDGPFMPVQYLAGQNGGAGTGDPASYQMVPVEQFLSRYAFVTGVGYTQHYAQIVRQKGGPEVYVDDVAVTGYYELGEYEVADWSISGGAHLAKSDAPFGIYQVGYTEVTSYAYPGGLRLKVINPQ